MKTLGPLHVGTKPGPMIYSADGSQVADLRSPSNEHAENYVNATYIVRAVNAHEALVQALEDASQALWGGPITQELRERVEVALDLAKGAK